jgi:hypothetical protein
METMTLQLEQQAALLTHLRQSGDLPAAAVIELVRRSYPEVFRTIYQVLSKGQEAVSIEPGDIVVIETDRCVMHRDHLMRRRVFRRDEEGREHEARERGGDMPEPLEIWKDIDSPKSGIAAIEWDRPRFGQEADHAERTGRILVTTFEPLGAATKEVPLRQLTDGARREFVEVFATRSIGPVLNVFFGVRAFLLEPETMLLARPDLHGTDRLQDLVRNPRNVDSEYMLNSYPEKHPEVMQFFRNLRDQAFVHEERRAEISLQSVSKAMSLEILTAIAVPQIHGTLANLLRMQFAFVQPHSVIGATLLSAGASLQPAWDMRLQLRLLDGLHNTGN